MAPAPQVEEEEVASDAEQSEVVEGLLWVPKAIIETVMSAVEKKEEVSTETVKQLIEADDVAEDAVMVPVDMSDCADIEDIDNIIETLGAKKVAETFAAGRKKFLDGLQSLSEEDRANVTQELSGKDYKEMMDEELRAFEEAMAMEEQMECGESENEEGDEEIDEEEVEEGGEEEAEWARMQQWCSFLEKEQHENKKEEGEEERPKAKGGEKRAKARWMATLMSIAEGIEESE